VFLIVSEVDHGITATAELALDAIVAEPFPRSERFSFGHAS